MTKSKVVNRANPFCPEENITGIPQTPKKKQLPKRSRENAQRVNVAYQLIHPQLVFTV